MALREAIHTMWPLTPGWLSRPSPACPPRELNCLWDTKKGTFGNPNRLPGENVKDLEVLYKAPLSQNVAYFQNEARIYPECLLSQESVFLSSPHPNTLAPTAKTMEGRHQDVISQIQDHTQQGGKTMWN